LTTLKSQSDAKNFRFSKNRIGGETEKRAAWLEDDYNPLEQDDVPNEDSFE
jgi:hypothetical protein